MPYIFFIYLCLEDDVWKDHLEDIGADIYIHWQEQIMMLTDRIP
jgi:hypothetical protein